MTDIPAHQVSRFTPLLVFALIGAPGAWLAQLLYAFATTSYYCDPAIVGGMPGWLGPTIVALNLATLAVGAASLAVALRLRQAGRDPLSFLAAWGVLLAIVFLVATVANSLSLFLVPLCRV
jgi:hypothetical protein